MLTRTIIVLFCVLLARSQSISADPLKAEIYVADGTATLKIVAKVTDAATRKPVVGATITAIRSGRGTTLLASDSTAMPPAAQTDVRGRAVLRADFRWAGSPGGSSVFVAQSFLRMQATGFGPVNVPVSAVGRLDFAPETKHYQVTLPIALTRE